MQLQIRRCSNVECMRPFQIHRFPRSQSIDTAEGMIVCPHCGTAEADDKQFIYVTNALTRVEEAMYEEFEASLRKP
jgi:hypothetical protein